MASLNWDGRENAVNETSSCDLSAGTLECRKKSMSKNNVYVGDNLDVLRYLKRTQGSFVDFIYIDPPYNTGSDFIYDDKMSTDGWLTFMYPRLYWGRQVMRENGIIMISIDDREAHRLRMLCDEIFGDDNFIAELVWEKRSGGGVNQRFFNKTHEYILVYARNKSKVEETFIVEMGEKAKSEFIHDNDDKRGKFAMFPLTTIVGNTEKLNPSRVYEIVSPIGIPFIRHWRCSREKYEKLVKEDRIHWRNGGRSLPYYKRFESERSHDIGGEVQLVTRPTSIIQIDKTHNRHSREEFIKLGLCDNYNPAKPSLFFDYPKPINLIKWLIKCVDRPQAHIMDFFGGSGTTAHACWNLNSEDSGNRTWSLVQIPEPTPEVHASRRAGLEYIHEVCIERLKRVSKDMAYENGLLAGMMGLDLDWQECYYVDPQ